MEGLSIAILTFNEAENLERVLNSLLPTQSCTFPFEIIIIDNGSTDRTKQIFCAFQAKYSELPLIWHSHEPNHLGKARQFALKIARYPILAFIDADCAAPEGWAKNLYAKLRYSSNPRLLAIGSGNFPPKETKFHSALGIILSSWFGNFNTTQAKIRSKHETVAHLPTCNIFLNRELALLAGGFSDKFRDVCEDLEFSQRAKAQGYSFEYLPSMQVEHFHKTNYFAWAKKIFRYGRGQLDVARHHPSHLIGIKGIPLLAGIFGLTMAFVNPSWVMVGFFIYLLFFFALSISLCWKKDRLLLTPRVLFLFTITHFFYVAGELWGLLILFRRR